MTGVKPSNDSGFRLVEVDCRRSDTPERARVQHVPDIAMDCHAHWNRATRAQHLPPLQRGAVDTKGIDRVASASTPIKRSCAAPRRGKAMPAMRVDAAEDNGLAIFSR
jgi:hypothetical protein